MTIVPTQADRETAFAILVHTDDNGGWGREYIREGGDDDNAVVQKVAAHRQAFLTEILDHLTTEHSGGLGSHPGARVVAEAIERKFGEGQQPS